MIPTRPDVFALKRSGLDAFLYAEVGAEANGSRLTILSLLARLGKDPWVEAARWAALPRAAVIDSLERSIAEMPLVPSALADARDSAARLVQLLPANALDARQGNPAQAAVGIRKWVPMTIMYFAFFVGLALNALLAMEASHGAAAPAHHLAKTPGAANTAARSRAEVAGPSAKQDRR